MSASLIESTYRLLEECFPAEELDEYECFRKDVESGLAIVILGHHDGEVAGAAVVYRYLSAYLLGYIAVDPAHRSSGVGSRLLQASIDLALGDDRVLFTEVERPDRHDEHPVFGDPDRRIVFFSEHGSLALDIPYFQPPLSGETGRRFGMILARVDPVDERVMDSAVVRSFLAEYVGGAADDDDDALLSLRASLTVPTVRLLPISDYGSLDAP